MSNVRPVRIGIVSTAEIARTKVIPGFRTTPWLDVAAIASRRLDTATAAAESLGIAKAYGSYEELFADPDIEAVYIPTPNDSHVDLSLAAARAGKHVLSEKPAGMDAADVRRLLDLPQGIIYLEAFMVRFHPQWIRVRELVRSGAIGTPVGVQGWFSYFNVDPANIRNRPETGGGGLLDIGVYPLVTARFVLDAEPKRVVAIAEMHPEFGTDRLTSALIDFGGGRHLTFTVGTDCAPHQRMNVVGTKARVEVMIPFNAPYMQETIIRVDDGIETGDAGIKSIVIPAIDQYGAQGEAFAKAVRGIEPLPYDARDAVQMMTILDAIKLSAREKRWVEL
jgi:predicted dehydrogenase